MDTSTANTVSEADMVDYYFSQLTRLSVSARASLIARLGQTLGDGATAPSEASPTLPDFVGAWANDPEADAMETAIRASRHFASKPELNEWE